jgi:hypothetical protein
MKIKSEQEEAIGKNRKITGYQLPNKKKLGWFCVLFQSSQFHYCILFRKL